MHPGWKDADESAPAFAARTHPAQLLDGSHRYSNHSGRRAAFQGNASNLTQRLPRRA
jgi:hypothetical protein